MFVNDRNGMSNNNAEDFPYMFPTKFRYIWPNGFRGKEFFFKSGNKKQESPVAAMFVNGSEQNEQSL